MRESTISRKGFFAFIGTAIAAVALSLAFAPNAFAASMSDPDVSIAADKLHIFVVDDTTLGELGYDYDLVVNNGGIMPGYEPGGSLTD